MRYAELKRRCEYALKEAIETGNTGMECTLCGILESLKAGPLKPGDVVDTSYYSRRADSTFGNTGTVQSCWIEELTGVWWVVVKDDSHSFAVANATWFSKPAKCSSS